MTLPIDAQVKDLPPAPPWGTANRGIYDALVGCINYERAHGMPPGTLVAAICDEPFFDDNETGKPPVML